MFVVFSEGIALPLFVVALLVGVLAAPVLPLPIWHPVNKLVPKRKANATRREEIFP
jgi:hypothetical protein